MLLYNMLIYVNVPESIFEKDELMAHLRIFFIFVLLFLFTFAVMIIWRNKMYFLTEDYVTSFGVKGGTENVILAMSGTTKIDPQRNRKMPSTFEYINNFYESVRALNLDAIIFHDNFTQQLVNKYTTAQIKFQKVAPSAFCKSSNDARFIIFNKWLNLNKYKKILIVDIADVFFYDDPFKYMLPHNADKLLMGKDQGNFITNRWMRKQYNYCYEERYIHENSLPVSAGCWGGYFQAVQCMLNCVVEQLNYTCGRNKRLCDMAVFNWCVGNRNCTNGNLLDDNPKLINPLRKHCDNKEYVIIHDKCPTSETKCMVFKNGTLTREICHSRHGYYRKTKKL